MQLPSRGLHSTLTEIARKVVCQQCGSLSSLTLRNNEFFFIYCVGGFWISREPKWSVCEPDQRSDSCTDISSCSHTPTDGKKKKNKKKQKLPGERMMYASQHLGKLPQMQQWHQQQQERYGFPPTVFLHIRYSRLPPPQCDVTWTMGMSLGADQGGDPTGVTSRGIMERLCALMGFWKRWVVLLGDECSAS